MAASSNKVTAVHFALIFFVMVTILLGVITYMSWSQSEKLSGDIAKAESDFKAQRDTNLKYQADLTRLKTLLGHQQPEVGDVSQPNTVANAISQEIQLAGASLEPGVAPTVSAHLTALRTQVDQLNADLDALRVSYQTQQTEVQTLQNQYAAQVAQHQQAAAGANQDLQNRIAQHQEIVDQKDADITRLQNEYTRVSAEYDQVKSAFDEFRAQSKQREDNLVRINNQLREKYESSIRLSFEVPDGLIRWVDNSTQVVYINLGQADHLPLRTTFSVYRKNHQGVGRGPEDIKGAIEVTRIIDAHLAEARITDQDYFSPIAVNDPIYSPVWEAGRKERFAIVGLIDIDGDGESDRDLFHQIIAAAGAEIQHEVDDQGQRTPGKIDDTTKFLVIGSVPDPATLSNEKEIQAAIEIGKRHADMREEAREQGVRAVTLHDFLNYMGYKPRRRVWRPGDERPYSLTAGARSTAVGESVGQSRTGTGQTSAVYGSGRLKQPTSGGNTAVGGGYQNGR
ncbi:MAG TPA: hypothetical protein VML55_26090 [Planctomycetaceae bacterium]|nr:hypothetical protein [Planctomycetaceae bacterium]